EVQSRTHRSGSKQASTEVPGYAPELRWRRTSTNKPSYLNWETKFQARIAAVNIEAQVTVKRRLVQQALFTAHATQRMHQRPRGTLSQTVGALKIRTMSEARRGSQSHHQRKPWLLLLEINERSPTSSSDSSFRLRPLEQDGEALKLAADGGDRGKQRRRRSEEKRQRPASFRQTTVADLTQIQRETNPRSTKTTTPPASIHKITTSPSLRRHWRHTQTSIWSPDPAVIRRKLEKKEQRGGEETNSFTGRGLDREERF
ncbi:unnamed protein product, partial [Brassica oleracea]